MADKEKFLDKDPHEYGLERSTFLSELQRFHAARRTPIHRYPTIQGKTVDLYLLYSKILAAGGYHKFTDRYGWEDVLHLFHLPSGCANGGEALKQIYLRFLYLYEKVHLHGEDVDGELMEDDEEAVQSRKRTRQMLQDTHMAYNYRQHNVPVHVREQHGMCTDLVLLNRYERLEKSLLSGLPNEVDIGLNVCVLLSAEGSERRNRPLRLTSHSRLLPILLAHVGLFEQGSDLEALHEKQWSDYTDRDFLKFWAEVVEDAEIGSLVCPTTSPALPPPAMRACPSPVHVCCLPGDDDPTEGRPSAGSLTGDTEQTLESSPSGDKRRGLMEARYERWRRLREEMREQARVDASGGALLNMREASLPGRVEGMRAVQVAIILHNLSFEAANAIAMCNSETALRFMLLCAYSQYDSLRQIGLDLIGNTALKMILKPITECFTQLLLRLVGSCLQSNDRFERIRGLEIVSNLAQVNENATLLKEHSRELAYHRIAGILSGVRDIQLIVGALDALYNLSSLGTETCDHIACVRNLIDTLMDMVTVETQSFGGEGLVGMKVIEELPTQPAMAHHPPAPPAPRPHLQPQQHHPQQHPMGPPPPPPHHVSTPGPPAHHPQHILPKGTPGQPAVRPPPPAYPAAAAGAPGAGGGVAHPAVTPLTPGLQAEVLAQHWVKAFYEADPLGSAESSPHGGAMSKNQVYSEYLTWHQKKAHTGPVPSPLALTQLVNCVRAVYPRTSIVRVAGADGSTDQCIAGLKKRTTPLGPTSGGQQGGAVPHPLSVLPPPTGPQQQPSAMAVAAHPSIAQALLETDPASLPFPVTSPTPSPANARVRSTPRPIAMKQPVVPPSGVAPTPPHHRVTRASTRLGAVAIQSAAKKPTGQDRTNQPLQPTVLGHVTGNRPIRPKSPGFPGQLLVCGQAERAVLPGDMEAKIERVENHSRRVPTPQSSPSVLPPPATDASSALPQQPPVEHPSASSSPVLPASVACLSATNGGSDSAVSSPAPCPSPAPPANGSLVPTTVHPHIHMNGDTRHARKPQTPQLGASDKEQADPFAKGPRTSQSDQCVGEETDSPNGPAQDVGRQLHTAPPHLTNGQAPLTNGVGGPAREHNVTANSLSMMERLLEKVTNGQMVGLQSSVVTTTTASPRPITSSAVVASAMVPSMGACRPQVASPPCRASLASPGGSQGALASPGVMSPGSGRSSRTSMMSPGGGSSSRGTSGSMISPPPAVSPSGGKGRGPFDEGDSGRMGGVPPHYHGQPNGRVWPEGLCNGAVAVPGGPMASSGGAGGDANHTATGVKGSSSSREQTDKGKKRESMQSPGLTEDSFSIKKRPRTASLESNKSTTSTFSSAASVGSSGRAGKSTRKRPSIARQSSSSSSVVGPAHAPSPHADAFLCEWDGCGAVVRDPSGARGHALANHLPRKDDCGPVGGQVCRWGGHCDGLVRQKWSLISHVLDVHCSERALAASRARRQHQAAVRGSAGTPGAHTPTPQAPPVSVPPPPRPATYAKGDATVAIMRQAPRAPYPDLADPREGPVTKHIRYTSALILRNLAVYSSLGRRQLRKHEGRLAVVAFSCMEASGPLCTCLAQLQQPITPPPSPLALPSSLAEPMDTLPPAAAATSS